MQEDPIGIFDSGVGGLSIYEKLQEVLPLENYIYLGDNKYSPYGKEDLSFIEERTFKCVEFLISKKCKLIVIACNTVTTSSIKKLRASYDIPFVGVEPAVKVAVETTKSKEIAVMATTRTIASSRYNELISKYNKQITIYSIAAKGLANAIEEINLNKASDILQNHTKAIKSSKTDKLVLGCTHYPFVKDIITKILGDKVEIITTGHPVAKQTKKRLKDINSLAQIKSQQDVLYTTGETQTLAAFLVYFLGITNEQIHTIDL